MGNPKLEKVMKHLLKGNHGLSSNILVVAKNQYGLIENGKVKTPQESIKESDINDFAFNIVDSTINPTVVWLNSKKPLNTEYQELLELEKIPINKLGGAECIVYQINQTVNNSNNIAREKELKTWSRYQR